jgi:hypothetical protein
VGECCQPTTGTVFNNFDACVEYLCSLGARPDGRGYGEPTGTVLRPAQTPCDDFDRCTYGETCDGLRAGRAGGCAGTDINAVACQSNTDCEELLPGAQCDPLGERCFCTTLMSRTVGVRTPPEAESGPTARALRVRLARLYDPAMGCPPRSGLADLGLFDGELRWAGPPREYSEDTVPAMPNFVASALECCPHFRDWSGAALEADFGGDGPGATGLGIDGVVDTGLTYLFGAEVVPCSIYELQFVDDTCPDLDNESCYTPPWRLWTGRWGNVWEPDSAHLSDVARIIAKFKGIPLRAGPPKDGAPLKVAAMLRSNLLPLGTKINFDDIARGLSAFKQIGYPEAGPTTHCEDPCP